MHDNIDLSGCCKMLHDIPSYDPFCVDPCTMLYRAFRDDTNVTVVEEGKDYTMTDNSDDKIALGMLVLASILAIGGVISLVALLIKHL